MKLYVFALILILPLINGQNRRAGTSNIMFPSNRPTVTTNNLLPKPGVCGFFDLGNRIYGGNEAALDEFPWLALIEFSKGGTSKGYHCGGSLINNRYVLTAAHCVSGNNIPKGWEVNSVRLGEWDLQNEQDCNGDGDCSDSPIDIKVEKIIAHDKYVPGLTNQYNDLALLRLSKSVTFSNFIKPICLPVTNPLKSSKFAGEQLFVAGWGRTEFGTRSSVKLKADIKTFDYNNCKSLYTGYNISLADSQICAGGVGGVDTCRGDSGGPLVGLDTSNVQLPHYFLAGIISFGPNPCGLEGWPGVYTRVGNFIEWIERNISA